MPTSLLEWAFFNVKGYRRSLALKLLSECSQWEDGPHGPSSPTTILSEACLGFCFLSNAQAQPGLEANFSMFAVGRWSAWTIISHPQ